MLEVLVALWGTVGRPNFASLPLLILPLPFVLRLDFFVQIAGRQFFRQYQLCGSIFGPTTSKSFLTKKRQEKPAAFGSHWHFTASISTFEIVSLIIPPLSTFLSSGFPF